MAGEVVNEITGNLNALANNSPEAFGAAIYEFALNVMGDAQERTPVDYGTLKASGTVKPPEITMGFGASIKVELGFGGGAATYAIYVHEDLDARHEVGEAKFLEKAMNNAAPDFANEVSERVASKLSIGP